MKEKRVQWPLPIRPLKTSSEWELVPRCEPSTYQPISRWYRHIVYDIHIFVMFETAIYLAHSADYRYKSWSIWGPTNTFRNYSEYVHEAYRRKEGNVLFNDTLNTFYLRLYGVRHMVKDHSDSEKGNPLPPHRLLFTINSKGSFICTIPQTG